MVYDLRMRTGLLLTVALCALGVNCSSTPDESSRGGTGGSAGHSGGSSGGTGGAVGSGGGGPGSGGASTGGSTGDGGSGGTAIDSDAGDVPDATAGNDAAMGGKGCAGVTATFCDDFEMQADGTAPTGDFDVKGNVTVDGAKGYSGTKSLHYKVPKPAKSIANITFNKQFPLANNDLHGRAWVYMNKTPATDSHWNFITSDNPTNQWSIGGQFGKFELVCDPPDNGLDSATPFPDGKWVCLQWEFKYPGAGDTTFVTKVDGVAVDQGEFTGANSKGEKWKAGPWSNLALGWEVFGSSDIDVEFWVDDLAFGQQEIPCLAAK
jgi:hypothetical protein